MKAVIEEEAFKRLELWQFSIFLQYLFEILVLIEQRSALSFQELEELIKSIN